METGDPVRGTEALARLTCAGVAGSASRGVAVRIRAAVQNVSTAGVELAVTAEAGAATGAAAAAAVSGVAAGAGAAACAAGAISGASRAALTIPKPAAVRYRARWERSRPVPAVRTVRMMVSPMTARRDARLLMDFRSRHSLPGRSGDRVSSVHAGCR